MPINEILGVADPSMEAAEKILTWTGDLAEDAELLVKWTRLQAQVAKLSNKQKMPMTIPKKLYYWNQAGTASAEVLIEDNTELPCGIYKIKGNTDIKFVSPQGKVASSLEDLKKKEEEELGKQLQVAAPPQDAGGAASDTCIEETTSSSDDAAAVMAAWRAAAAARDPCDVGKCASCLQEFPKRVLRRCSACKAVRYCSGKCQRRHWRAGGHKEECCK